MRIMKELKEGATRFGIDVKSVVEKTLGEEIKRVKKEHLKRIIKECLANINVSNKEWIASVKESRIKR